MIFSDFLFSNVFLLGVVVGVANPWNRPGATVFAHRAQNFRSHSPKILNGAPSTHGLFSSYKITLNLVRFACAAAAALRHRDHRPPYDGPT